MSCYRYLHSHCSHVAHHGQSPAYIKDIVVPIMDLPSRTQLRSAAAGRYDVQLSRTEFGRQAFSVAAPVEWNALPGDLRAIPDISRFKRMLKAHLFRLAFE